MTGGDDFSGGKREVMDDGLNIHGRTIPLARETLIVLKIIVSRTESSYVRCYVSFWNGFNKRILIIYNYNL